MKILIADDHALVRQGLRQLLADEELGLPNASGDLSFLEADGFDAALEALATKGADLLLIDLSMPGMAGASSLRALREAHPTTKIVVITGWEDRATMLDCLGAGVHGYVPKSFATDQIVKAIEVILSGGIYVPSEIANLDAGETALHNGSGGKDKPNPSLAALVPGLARFTKRQLDVLLPLGQGPSTKEIAPSLEPLQGTLQLHLPPLYPSLTPPHPTH